MKELPLRTRMPWKNPLLLQNEWLCLLGVLLEVLLFFFFQAGQAIIRLCWHWQRMDCPFQLHLCLAAQDAFMPFLALSYYRVYKMSFSFAKMPHQSGLEPSLQTHTQYSIPCLLLPIIFQNVQIYLPSRPELWSYNFVQHRYLLRLHLLPASGRRRQAYSLH